VRHWHRTARDLCEGFDPQRYAAHKAWCDRYLPPQAPRGGARRRRLFFDDLNADGFERSFAYQRAVGDGYLDAYLPIVDGAATRPSASASASSSCTGAAATSSSTWSGTAARCSGCSPAGAPRAS
jgi:coproporphyrinogen III oxidase